MFRETVLRYKNEVLLGFGGFFLFILGAIFEDKADLIPFADKPGEAVIEGPKCPVSDVPSMPMEEVKVIAPRLNGGVDHPS